MWLIAITLISLINICIYGKNPYYYAENTKFLNYGVPKLTDMFNSVRVCYKSKLFE